MIIEVSKYENFKMLVNFTVQKRENAKTRKLIFASQNFIVNFKKREFETQKNRFVVKFLNNFTVKFETRKLK
jgi:hypothetical protein